MPGLLPEDVPQTRRQLRDLVTSQGSIAYVMAWLAAHCNDDWEHGEGVEIATLDNPGWRLTVDVECTELEGIEVDWRKDDRPDTDWVHWRSTGRMFEAVGGPMNLLEMLGLFEEFSKGHTP